MEQLERSPDLAEALLFGTGRPQAALLLEMKQETLLETPQQPEEVLLRLWALVEEVNKLYPEYARLTRELTMILRPAKRMVRGAKGTVQRSATVALYEEELDVNFYRHDGHRLKRIILACYLELSMIYYCYCRFRCLDACKCCRNFLSAGYVVNIE